MHLAPLPSGNEEAGPFGSGPDGASFTGSKMSKVRTDPSTIIEPGREKVALLLAHPGLRLPEGSQLVENAMERTRR